GLQNTCGFNAQLSRGTGRIGVMHFGVESASRLLRFSIGLLKGKKTDESIPVKMKKLLLNTRAVFDILKMTRNAMPRNGNFAGA
ncbi:MAG: hypothetical protein AB2807_05565, partial [Candidatus Sedimenticola endophacoides]